MIVLTSGRRGGGAGPAREQLRYVAMADLQRRPNYTPRRAREQRAYRLAVAGAGFGGLGVIGIVLAVVGVVGAGLPVVALIIAALCAAGFKATVS